MNNVKKIKCALVAIGAAGTAVAANQEFPVLVRAIAGVVASTCGAVLGYLLDPHADAKRGQTNASEKTQ